MICVWNWWKCRIGKLWASLLYGTLNVSGAFVAIRSGQAGIGHGALLIKFLPHSLFPIPHSPLKSVH
jgi:hypothetical protein